MIGGGIGGASAALALAQTGWQVEVFERAEAATEVGAGLQLGPNATRVLAAWGVEVPQAMHPQRVEMRDGPSGRLEATVALGKVAQDRFGAPYIQVHRQDLLEALMRGARAAGATFHFGAPIDAKAPPPADLLVAADGVRSTFRETLNPGAKPRFTGQVAWRALAPSAELDPTATQLWMGAGRHVVAYPLRDGRQWNVVAVEERHAWTEEGWHQEADPAALRTAFANWPAADLLERVERTILWGLFAHGPLGRWHDGRRLCLLGDACHPMLPFMAQGAAMAIEDAWVLAASLQDAPIPEALERYQAARLPRTARVQAVAQRNARLYHVPTAPLRRLRGLGLGTAQHLPGGLLGRFDWLYGADVTR